MHGFALFAAGSPGLRDYPLIATIAAGFTAAWVLGLFTQWLRLSPIVGYLLAGVLIGPYTPGFQGDLALAHQLAEVGVILLMFGVGMHFHLGDLLAVRGIAVPGAIGQSLGATGVSVAVFHLFGIPPTTGAVIGMAMAVASTVVLMRVLMDADALHSPAGHIAVGWLLVEDVLTVIVLVIIPTLGTGAGDGASPVTEVLIALAKLAALIATAMVVGSSLVPWVLARVARLRSHELFTLTVLVFSVAIAAGAYVLFGASMALGAFLAGMMVARSPVSHQAAADALPLRDAFAVLFFVSVGMVFDPRFLVREPLMMLAAMSIILLVKPLIALVLVIVLGHSVRTALTVAIGLAQIGEFSFILSDLARKNGLMPEDAHNVLVAGAILSITLNPVLFRSIGRIEAGLRTWPRLWNMLNDRAERKHRVGNAEVARQLDESRGTAPRRAVVVGFGPVGRTVDRLLRDAGLATVIIDMNMDTIAELRRDGQPAIFGDASRPAILEGAGITDASHLVLTLPQPASRAAIVETARDLNPKLKIFVRARYLSEQSELEHVGTTAAIFEEGEAAVALARLVLADTGAGTDAIERSVRDIRTRLILDNVSSLRTQRVRQVMVPWTRVRRLTAKASLDDVREQVGSLHFSRWPVVDAGTGRPLGYLLANDLIGLNPQTTTWTSLIRRLESVGPDDDVESTLLQFQKNGTTICLVEQRGAPLGIVTVEDILEQVVGRMGDEYARRTEPGLPELLLAEDSLLSLASETDERAIEEMARAIPAELLPADADVAGRAVARERELPTDLGFGVAIPHARVPGLARPIVVFGRSESGVVFDRRSSDLVHLLFLLVTPSERPDMQVHLLSQIARAAGQPETRSRLCAAVTAEEVRTILAAESVAPSGGNSATG